MNDIILGILVLAAVSAALFACGMGVARHCRPRTCGRLAAAGMIFLLAFALIFHGRLVLAVLLPVSNAIVLGNWLAPGAALLAGMVAGYGTAPAWRRWSLGLMVLGLGWYSVASPWRGSPPSAGEPWYRDGFCMQTADGSCSACCAASLLRYYGIQADEREMIDRCQTRPWGTPPLCLYRGLKQKLHGTPWRVEVYSGSVARLRRENRYPVLLLLDSERASDRRPVTLWQRLSNVGPGHTVVVYQIHPSGNVEVGDPACGRVEWSVKDLYQRWTGEGLRLVRCAAERHAAGAVRVTSLAGNGSGRPASRSPAAHDPRRADGRPPEASPAYPSARP